MKRPAWLPLLDLRPITRDSDHAETQISVILQNQPVLWIQAGRLSHFNLSPSNQNLGAYFRDGVTDFEHDSAYAFHINVVGTFLHQIYHGVVELRAWLASRADDTERFKIPVAPIDLDSLEWCSSCTGSERHRVGAYTPKPHRELWERLRGAELVIQIAPVTPEEA